MNRSSARPARLLRAIWTPTRTALVPLAVVIASTAFAPTSAGTRVAASSTPETIQRLAPGMLVSPDWLADHLDDPHVVILDADSRRDRYDTGHIPGARFLDMGGLAWEGDPAVGTELRAPAEIAKALEEVGVREDQRVVVYGENPLLASRAWMTLDVMGLGERASLLDGGLGGWRRSGRPLSTDAPSVMPGSVTLHPRNDVLVDARWIHERLDDASVTLVDARPDEEYTGADGGMGGRLHAGHVPGAYSLYWEQLVESRDVPMLKDREELERLFRASGAAAGSTVVPYCLTGVRASFAYFVARMLGYDAKFYDGSWRDWGSRDLPFVSGSSRR